MTAPDAQASALNTAAAAFLAARTQPKETAVPAGPRTITVRLADAPTDVLVDLVDHGPGTFDRLVRLAPPDATRPRSTVASALISLVQMGLVETVPESECWAATDDGRAMVAEARANAAAVSS